MPHHPGQKLIVRTLQAIEKSLRRCERGIVNCALNLDKFLSKEEAVHPRFLDGKTDSLIQDLLEAVYDYRMTEREQLDATLPKAPRFPRPASGCERAYVQCVTCGWVGYYDFVPFAFSSPSILLGCGHLVGNGRKGLRDLPKKAWMLLYREQLAHPRLKKKQREILAEESNRRSKEA